MIPDYDDFAKDWQAAWNAHDLDRIMAHYSEDIVFRSRKAFAHLGLGEMRGQAQLRSYWEAALQAQPDLRFEVQQILGGHKMAVLVYSNHKGVTAAETLYFREDGLVEVAAACHANWAFTNPYRVQVDLWMREGQEQAFRVYEEQAFVAMTNYGGRVADILEPEVGPDQRHILEFPTQKAFDAYRNGPESEAARPERERCILRTEVKELTP